MIRLGQSNTVKDTDKIQMKRWFSRVINTSSNSSGSPNSAWTPRARRGSGRRRVEGLEREDKRGTSGSWAMEGENCCGPESSASESPGNLHWLEMKVEASKRFSSTMEVFYGLMYWERELHDQLTCTLTEVWVTLKIFKHTNRRLSSLNDKMQKPFS